MSNPCGAYPHRAFHPGVGAGRSDFDNGVYNQSNDMTWKLCDDGVEPKRRYCDAETTTAHTART